MPSPFTPAKAGTSGSGIGSGPREVGAEGLSSRESALKGPADESRNRLFRIPSFRYFVFRVC
jgi:hypothetical protein